MLHTDKNTQKQRLLKFLQDRGQAGAYVYEIIAPRPTGLGIAQYNARILELREEGHPIINKEAGHFVLENAQEKTPSVPQKTAKLEGASLKTWEEMGALLRKKAQKVDTFTKQSEEAFI